MELAERWLLAWQLYLAVVWLLSGKKEEATLKIIHGGQRK
jgi:hypothetical protein